jgi:hypothetical protein
LLRHSVKKWCRWCSRKDSIQNNIWRNKLLIVEINHKTDGSTSFRTSQLFNLGLFCEVKTYLDFLQREFAITNIRCPRIFDHAPSESRTRTEPHQNRDFSKTFNVFRSNPVFASKKQFSPNNLANSVYAYFIVHVGCAFGKISLKYAQRYGVFEHLFSFHPSCWMACRFKRNSKKFDILIWKWYPSCLILQIMFGSFISFHLVAFWFLPDAGWT